MLRIPYLTGALVMVTLAAGIAAASAAENRDQDDAGQLDISASDVSSAVVQLCPAPRVLFAGRSLQQQPPHTKLVLRRTTDRRVIMPNVVRAARAGAPAAMKAAPVRDQNPLVPAVV